MDYDKLIAPAAAAMRPSGIRKFFDLAADMPECISLGVGEPDFKTPWSVREAGIESLEHGRTRYTANAGLKELRAEICRYLERRMNLHYDPLSQVLVTVGGSEAIDMCIRTVVQPGDEVVIPEPCFVCYEPITTLSGGVPVHVACRQEDEFRLRPEALKAAITPRTKLLIMPFPNNPTGAVMEKEDLEAIADVLRDTNVLVLSDEIYAELNYGLRPRLHCHPARHGRADHRGERLLQELCDDRLASGPCLRPGSHHQDHDQDPPERHHERPHHQPVCRHHGPEGLRRRDRPDAG